MRSYVHDGITASPLEDDSQWGCVSELPCALCCSQLSLCAVLSLKTQIPLLGNTATAKKTYHVFLLSLALKADLALHQFLRIVLDEGQIVQLVHDAVLHLVDVRQRGLQKKNKPLEDGKPIHN